MMELWTSQSLHLRPLGVREEGGAGEGEGSSTFHLNFGANRFRPSPCLVLYMRLQMSDARMIYELKFTQFEEPTTMSRKKEDM